MPDDPRTAKLKRQTMLLSEFLVQRAPNYMPAKTQQKILLHMHCHHRAIFNMKDEVAVLNATGAKSNCSTRAAAAWQAVRFEKKSYGVSQTLGERVLLPAVRAAAPGTVIVTDGFSCREQIAQNTIVGPSIWRKFWQEDMTMKTALHAVKGVVLVLCLGLLIGRAAVMGQRRATANNRRHAIPGVALAGAARRPTSHSKMRTGSTGITCPDPGSARAATQGNDTCAASGGAETAGSALSAKGIKQTGQIMNDLELVLRGDGPSPAMNRDPEICYFTVFGTPSDQKAWGWRVEGHIFHRISRSPTEPSARGRRIFTVRIPPKCCGIEKGLRVLAAEEDKAFALLRALDAQQKQAAVLQDKVPNDMITTNARRANR